MNFSENEVHSLILRSENEHFARRCRHYKSKDSKAEWLPSDWPFQLSLYERSIRIGSGDERIIVNSQLASPSWRFYSSGWRLRRIHYLSETVISSFRAGDFQNTGQALSAHWYIHLWRLLLDARWPVPRRGLSRCGRVHGQNVGGRFLLIPSAGSPIGDPAIYIATRFDGYDLTFTSDWYFSLYSVGVKSVNFRKIVVK